MTLRTDLAALLAEAGIVDVDIEAALADQHVRSAAYHKVLAVLAAASHRDDDRAVLARILRDPDELVSKTAVVALVDRIALKTADPAAFRTWASAWTPELDRLTADGHRRFIHHRITDWTLYLSAQTGHTPTPTELATATDWMQRKLATESMSQPLLTLLTESARTKKIRNLARSRTDPAEHRPRDKGRAPRD